MGVEPKSRLFVGTDENATCNFGPVHLGEYPTIQTHPSSGQNVVYISRNRFSPFPFRI